MITLKLKIVPSQASPERVVEAIRKLVELDEGSEWQRDRSLRELLLRTASSTKVMHLALTTGEVDDECE